MGKSNSDSGTYISSEDLAKLRKNTEAIRKEIHRMKENHLEHINASLNVITKYALENMTESQKKEFLKKLNAIASKN